jgi:sugar lactone lactonase YvrE
MASFTRILLLIGLGLLPCLARAQTIVPIGGSFNAPAHMTTDSAGNVFVADSGANVVREILADGGYVTSRTFGNGMGPPQGVAVDSQGNIFVLDTARKTINELVAASGYATIRPLGGQNQFSMPTGIALDSAGNLFVLDDGFLSEIPAAGGYSTVNGVPAGTTVTGLEYVAVDGSGNLYVAGANGVQKILAANGYQTVETLGYGFGSIGGIAVDGSGNVYVASNNAVMEIPAAGGPIPTVKTLGSGFLRPAGLTLDTSGNVFVADQGNNAVKEIVAFGGYATVETLGSGFDQPVGVVLGPDGNLFVADTGGDAIKEIAAAGNYASVEIVSYGFNDPAGIAVDSRDNLFVADTGNNSIKEIPAAGGYATVMPVGSGFSYPVDVAVDSAGNLYVADVGSGAVKEILAAGGYVTVNSLLSTSDTPQGVAVDTKGNVFVAIGSFNFPPRYPASVEAVQEILAVNGSIPPSPTVVTLSTNFGLPTSVAVDGADNVYVTDGGTVTEFLAAGGYATATSVATGFNNLGGVAVAGNGAIFVSDTGNKTVDEIFLTPPTPLFAAVLPDSRSVQVGTTATIFASLINSGADTLDNCRIALEGLIPAGLTLGYQTTDPTTNNLTGTPNTPVSIPGNDGAQTFVLSFTGTTAFSAPSMPLSFTCDGVTPASVIPGIDTVDLSMSDTPVADIIALAATVSNNGIVELPQNGAAAFAVATSNLGATAAIAATVDTGTDVLPVSLTLCQSDPSNGACLNPASSLVFLTDTAGATPTFSIFVAQSGSGTIAFSPATARIFVRFTDADGNLHGSTSVAVETTN